MKNLKSGFTLAEVLITLSIIGIIAAIVMPAVISSYQYKTVGVKLGKFASTTEDATRAYVVQNDSFSTEKSADVQSFINEAYMIKELQKNGAETKPTDDDLKTLFGDKVDVDQYKTYYTLPTDTDVVKQYDKTGKLNSSALVGYLKDNTTISVNMLASNAKYTAHKGVVDTAKVGMPVFNINFAPQANGLPKTVQKDFNFIVTELGYVVPADDDNCLWQIYSDNWSTNAKTFSVGSACNNGTNGFTSTTSES